MSVQTEARAAERRANLLAGLNDAPAALIGWEVEDRSHVRLRTGELIPVSRYRRLDTMWWALKGGAYAERVRTDQATRYHALTGRRLPDPHLREKSPMTALDAMENLQDALREAARPVVVMLDTILESVSKIAFPRLPLADPTQGDVVKGA